MNRDIRFKSQEGSAWHAKCQYPPVEIRNIDGGSHSMATSSLVTG